MNLHVGGGIEGTSLDMLKNTPWNIRKLTSEIEQCEGRQKYLAHTRSPSDGGDVRWYFCKVPLAVNELAASVPRTEIVGKGDYFRFGMRDSLAIEASFLQREDELLSSWWKEYAECSEGPRGTTVISKSTLQAKDLFSGSPESAKLYETEEERVGVPVKGGLYEVDLVSRHCFSVYWNGENRRVLRGHWFARKGGLDWLPLREDVSEQLEYAYRTQVWHRRTFQLSGLFAARVDLQGSTPGLHALFIGEDDTWEAWLSVDASGFSGVVGFGGNVIKLRRGYAPSQSQKPTQDELRQQKEEEMDDYCSQVPVRHLVFMVHGIGQRLEKSNLVDDVGDFRHVTASVAERHLTSHQLATQRVLYIPCQSLHIDQTRPVSLPFLMGLNSLKLNSSNFVMKILAQLHLAWRKGLALSGEAAVEKITLDGVRGLRTMLSATVHDILYYMSPIYCQEIIDSVSNQLNKLYVKFMKRNPGYDGKVSLYGHSLGSVLSYDILCHQQTLCSPFPMEWMYKEQKGSEVPCSVRNNLTSSCNPISNFRDNNSENVEIGSLGCHADYPDLSEEPVEGMFNLSPPASSESDVSSIDIDDQQTIDTLSLDENSIEPFRYSNHTEFSNSILMSDPSSMKTNVASYGDDSTDDKAISDNNKSETIKSLREEIDLLKSKLREIETDKVLPLNVKKGTTVVNQSDPERVQREHRGSLKSYTPQIRYTKLEFKVDTFFAVGSPLGVFLSLRNIRIGIGKGKEYWKEENINEEMPACRQMFNIFHPFDPVAYRIEPLICKEFIHKPPVIIPYHRGGKRLYVAYRELKEGLTTRSKALVDDLSNLRVKVLTLCEPTRNDGRDEQFENTQEKEERSYGSVMMDRLIGHEGGRIDHVLQDKTFRHPYVSAIGAHTNYWRDHDTALLMLKHLYGDIAAEEEAAIEGAGAGAGSSISNRLLFKGWSDPREVAEAEADEELPLTFADSVFINHFSHQLKKVIKK